MDTGNKRSGLVERLLRADELSERLRVSVRSVWKLTELGQLPPPIRFGRCTRWRESDIHRWLEGHAAGTTRTEAVDGGDEHASEHIEEVTP